MTCETCRWCYKLLNKENIRIYGQYYCQWWKEYHLNINKPCYGHIEKEEDEGVKMNHKFIVQIGMKDYVNIDCAREFVKSLRIILEEHPDIVHIGLIEVPVEDNEGRD